MWQEPCLYIPVLLVHHYAGTGRRASRGRGVVLGGSVQCLGQCSLGNEEEYLRLQHRESPKLCHKRFNIAWSKRIGQLLSLALLHFSLPFIKSLKKSCAAFSQYGSNCSLRQEEVGFKRQWLERAWPVFLATLLPLNSPYLAIPTTNQQTITRPLKWWQHAREAGVSQSFLSGMSGFNWHSTPRDMGPTALSLPETWIWVLNIWQCLGESFSERTQLIFFLLRFVVVVLGFFLCFVLKFIFIFMCIGVFPACIFVWRCQYPWKWS